MIVSRWAYDVRRHWVKSVLMYKILNEKSAPSLREKFIKIKDLNREYNLRSNDTIEHFQNLKQTILNEVLSTAGCYAVE
jgi:hypothetical protein